MLWEKLGISESEWAPTPLALRTVLISQQQQIHQLQIRCAAYEQELAVLRAQVLQIDDRKAEIAELKERLGRNSNNSSQPPSAAAPAHRKQKQREISGRKRGAQRGHLGAGRCLKPRAEVDQIIALRPTNCHACGSLLWGDDPQPARHQVSEIPPLKAVITEYQRHSLSCAACGMKTTAAWPAAMPPGCFGPNAQALIGYLSGRLGASQRDVAEILTDLFGVNIALGSISAVQQRVSEALAAPVAAARQFTQKQRVQYVDETSWQESTQAKWLWINATADVTAFHLLHHRNAQCAQTVIDKQAKGIVTTDRYSGYQWLPKQRRQICWAHLKRDFQAIAERAGDAGKLGAQLLAQVQVMCKQWHDCRASDNHSQLARKLLPVKGEIKKLLQAGCQLSHQKTRHTCQHILKVWEALWTFVRVAGVEPTNNNAERPLRRAVLWRRKSFGTQSAAGSAFVARILTTITTLRQQKRNVLAYLAEACSAALTQTPPPSLLPL